jgi:hypothetical protein
LIVTPKSRSFMGQRRRRLQIADLRPAPSRVPSGRERSLTE